MKLTIIIREISEVNETKNKDENTNNTDGRKKYITLKNNYIRDHHRQNINNNRNTNNNNSNNYNINNSNIQKKRFDIWYLGWWW